MTDYPLHRIRDTFLRYFEKNGHAAVPSAPLVPQSDPTLLFTNAGMVPFKPVFLGKEDRGFTRAASSQKCVRAGGKHNDLDNVGYTARHHTFFEMLGNFSFADYFKEEAIFYAWDLLTKQYALPKEKLTVTVYHTDDEAFTLWKKISGLPEERIIRIATDDNFWSMGDTGPCGPCSEIFYDHGESVAGGPPGSPDEDGDRFMEIWNLVFMQFDRAGDGTQTPLPAPCIDTGMGLERIASVLQGEKDNYDTDLFRELNAFYEDALGVKITAENKPSFKALSDHIRSACFLPADGVLPSNEGRGYVLRRIIRRAIRHAYMLGARQPVFCKGAPRLRELMGAAYPELERAGAMTDAVLQAEEEKFLSTLGKGLDMINDALPDIPDNGALPGKTAFLLYDTYGFPPDLTEDILQAHGKTVDSEGFDACMAEQKKRARAAWKGSGDAAADDTLADIRAEAGATEFLGYSFTTCDAAVTGLTVSGARAKEAKKGDRCAFILSQTPFYGESGGQEGDKGMLTAANGAKAIIRDTQKAFGDMHVHIGEVTEGVFALGDTVSAEIDTARRARLKRAHSATHILHTVLRNIVGEHLTQKGSLVTEDRFRFDFSAIHGLTPEQIAQAEKDVNAVIMQNLPAETRLMATDAALESGALGLFGEKYGDEVRVVAFGADGDCASKELCGGTHVTRTGDIGFFKILSESAIASGVRRIECLTGEEACAYAAGVEKALADCARAGNIAAADVPARFAELSDAKRQAEKDIAALRKQIAELKSAAGGSSAEQTINGVRLVTAILEDIDAKQLRELALKKAGESPDTLALYAATGAGRISLLACAGPDAASKMPADGLIRELTSYIGARGGGGKANMAQTGGDNPDGAEAAFKAAAELLGEA